MTGASPRPLRPGDVAPGFTLPAVNRDGTVSLEDYRGRSAVLVGLFRGLHCPFCRRQIVQLGTTRQKLEAIGVDTVAVVNTPADRARLYFKHRPTRILIASDPDAATHRDFGLPAFSIVRDEASAHWPERATIGQLRKVPVGHLAEPVPAADFFKVVETINNEDGFEKTAADDKIIAAHWTQLTGHFLTAGASSAGPRSRRPMGSTSSASSPATRRSLPPPTACRTTNLARKERPSCRGPLCSPSTPRAPGSAASP